MSVPNRNNNHNTGQWNCTHEIHESLPYICVNLWILLQLFECIKSRKVWKLIRDFETFKHLSLPIATFQGCIFVRELQTMIIAVCMYRLVMINIDLSETAHFAHWKHQDNFF